MEKIDYKFNEDTALEVVKQYIDKTYEQHYSKGKFQSTEFIFDAEHGVGFCIGNIIKYAQRYGKKEGFNPTDLMKIIHYAIMLYGVNHTIVLDGEEYGRK
jgi:hypothetical protein|tara:strand:- start:148 stop:447 length:300 start_codon:yes stop_codon:yes gene_type:complete